jgi:hypothetical protein
LSFDFGSILLSALRTRRGPNEEPGQQDFSPLVLASLAGLSEPFLGLHDKPLLNRYLTMYVHGRMDIIGALVRQPQDLNGMAGEVSEVLQSCSVPESSLSPEERTATANMLKGVMAINNTLVEGSHSSGGSDDTAKQLLLLFFRNIITATNLEALLRMTNADIRTGEVRCMAFHFINDLAEMMSWIWNVKLSDGAPFSSHVIMAYAKNIQDEASDEINTPHDTIVDGCSCPHSMYETLSVALIQCNDKCILERIYSYDWTAILQWKWAIDTCPGCPFEKNAIRFQKGYSLSVCHGTDIFMTLHSSVCNPAFRDDPGDHKAKILFQKMGASHELLGSLLRGSISGQLWRASVYQTPVGLLQKLVDIAGFFEFFVYYFMTTALPLSREINELLGPAHSSLTKALSKVRQQLPTACREIGLCKASFETYLKVEYWKQLQELSDEDRWERFLQCNHFQNPDAPSLTREMRRTHTKLVQEKWDGHEICANCFTLEKDLKGDKKLLKCAACKQIMYCSRDCQVEHWKTTHKKQCNKKKN